MRLSVLSAAGNAFAVLDGATRPAPQDLPGLARAICADRGSELFARAVAGGLRPPGGRALDGLLVALAPTSGGDVRMLIHNADGSRPEACGNGLRCLGRFAREHGLAGGDEVRVETDAGPRRVRLLRQHGRIATVRASMGRASILAVGEELSTEEGPVRATLVELGNPHCVVFVDDEREAPVEHLGPLLERHPRFPRRTNVEFAARRGAGLAVRVWERGVGETAACGTGACATALAAALDGRLELPAEVDLPGGRLGVSMDDAGELWLEGPCFVHAEGPWNAAMSPDKEPG